MVDAVLGDFVQSKKWQSRRRRKSTSFGRLLPGDDCIHKRLPFGALGSISVLELIKYLQGVVLIGKHFRGIALHVMGPAKTQTAYPKSKANKSGYLPLDNAPISQN